MFFLYQCYKFQGTVYGFQVGNVHQGDKKVDIHLPKKHVISLHPHYKKQMSNNITAELSRQGKYILSITFPFFHHNGKKGMRKNEEKKNEVKKEMTAIVTQL